MTEKVEGISCDEMDTKEYIEYVDIQEEIKRCSEAVPSVICVMKGSVEYYFEGGMRGLERAMKVCEEGMNGDQY